jgi:hypothetical protein
LNNEHRADGTAPPSKPRPKRTRAATAYRYRSQLNDAATRILQWKRPNAQKHGVFAVNPAIAGEDPQEFRELHSALIDEWQPSGSTEEDLVISPADLMWRKRRAQKFLQSDSFANAIDPGHPAFDEAFGFVRFMFVIRFEPETAFEKHARSCLRTDKINYLKQRFPRSNYQSTSEWAEAIIKEIKSVLLPATPLVSGARTRGGGRRFDESSASNNA